MEISISAYFRGRYFSQIKNKFIVLLIVALFATGCGEAGIEIDLSKTSTVEFTIPASSINANPDNIGEETEIVDFASDDFDEYIDDDLESVTIEKLVYEVSNYNNISGNIQLADLSLSISENGVRQEILNISGLIVENTGEILAYEDGNPSSELSPSQIAALEDVSRKIANRQQIEFIARLDFTNDIDSDLDISFGFDVTLRLKQD